jgi:hypothetical protein
LLHIRSLELSINTFKIAGLYKRIKLYDENNIEWENQCQMMKMKKENKQTKKRYQPLLTHKTCVSNHLIESIKHRKITKPNS